MPQVGVRELKLRANEILRRVREDQETFTVTYRGRVVAKLVPAEDIPTERARAAVVWAHMDELAREIGANWSPPEVSAAEAVTEQRRDL